MEETLSFRDQAGNRIAAVLAEPQHTTDSVAVLCHGFLSHKNSTSNQALAELFQQRSIATLRFDCFGHGDSEGPFAKLTTSIGVAQARAALTYVMTRGYRRLALVGSSFGGLVSLLAAAGGQICATPRRRIIHRSPASHSNARSLISAKSFA